MRRHKDSAPKVCRHDSLPLKFASKFAIADQSIRMVKLGWNIQYATSRLFPCVGNNIYSKIFAVQLCCR